MLHAALLTAASFAHGHLLALYRLLALAIPSRHGLRGVTSHHFALALPRLSRHGLHGVASHHFVLALVLCYFSLRCFHCEGDSIANWAEPAWWRSALSARRLRKRRACLQPGSLPLILRLILSTFCSRTPCPYCKCRILTTGCSSEHS